MGDDGLLLKRDLFGVASDKRSEPRFRLRIFRDDEVTEVWYENVTHVFWTNRGTVLTICLPDEGRHANWLASQISHYDIFEQGTDAAG